MRGEEEGGITPYLILLTGNAFIYLLIYLLK
jgi:hypothetical protein